MQCLIIKRLIFICLGESQFKFILKRKNLKITLGTRPNLKKKKIKKEKKHLKIRKQEKNIKNFTTV